MKSTSSRPAFERREADWLGVEEARARVLSSAEPLPPQTLGLGQALGGALAEEVRASATLPPWDNSAMDGYAVRAEDVAWASEEEPVVLRVVAVARAGDRSPVTVGPGEAARIMTGAPLPPGADTVVRVEDTDAEAAGARVRILRGSTAGRYVRGAGGDILEGETVLAPGHTITPGTVGLLAAAGRAEVLVHRSATVAILTTGDELRAAADHEDVRSGWAIPDSNSPMLAAMTRAAGAHSVPLGIARDDPDEIRQRILAGSDADVLVCVGGASMGEADLVKRVLEDLGFELDFWRVRMRPGSPVSFGWLPEGQRRQPVFGLPGNPGSAFVTFEVFVRPFLLALGGHHRTFRRSVRCRSADELRLPARLTHFQRVTLSAEEGGPVARLTGSQGSGLVSGLARADGLAVVPEEVDVVRAGEELDVLLLVEAPAGASAGTG